MPEHIAALPLHLSSLPPSLLLRVHLSSVDPTANVIYSDTRCNHRVFYSTSALRLTDEPRSRSTNDTGRSNKMQNVADSFTVGSSYCYISEIPADQYVSGIHGTTTFIFNELIRKETFQAFRKF